MDQPVRQRSGRTTTRVDLAEAVYAVGALPRKQAAAMVDQVLDEISAAIVRDGVVSIANFGKFTVLSKSPRIGRNPKSAKAVIISARRVVTFKPAVHMKKVVNGWNDETAGE